MEKIVLGNDETMEIHNISATESRLELSFKEGDFVSLEDKFSNAEILGKIILEDETGQAMRAFKRYTTLKEVKKVKGVVINDITDETADIVVVALEREPEWIAAQRQQNARIAAMEDTTDKLTMKVLS